MAKKKILLVVLLLVIAVISYVYLSDRQNRKDIETTSVNEAKTDLNLYEEDTIIEGHGWKNIVLGVSKDNIIGVIGEPSEIINYSDVYFYNYYPLGIQINFNRALNTAKAIFFYNNQS